MIVHENTEELDWMDLVDHTESAYQWIVTLLSLGQAEIALQVNAEQERILWHLYAEQRAAQRLEGRQVLFFTYPHIYENTEDGVRSTAVLRWPVTLQPPLSMQPEWRISASNQQAKLNKGWLRRLPKPATDDKQFSWLRNLEHCLEDKAQAVSALSLWAQQLAEHTAVAVASIQPALSARPPQGVTPNLELWWSGKLALLRDSWEDRTELPTHWHQPILPEQSAIDQLCLSRLSPSQYHFFKQVSGQRYTLADGNPIANLSNNALELTKLALANGKRCLLVARTKAGLDRLHEAFTQWEDLAHLALVWHDEQTDLPVLQGIVRAYEKSAQTAPEYDLLAWRTDLSRCNRIQRQYDQWFQASRQRVFGQKTWSALLGAYLHYARGEGKALLSSQLSASGYDFTVEEYDEITQAITRSRSLYRQVGSLQHPLRNLNAAIFIHQSLEESKTFILDTSSAHLQQANGLHQRYVRIQSQYADQLAGYYEEQFLQLRSGLEQLEELYEDGENAHGKDTLRSGNRTLRFYGRFSDKFQLALNSKQAIVATYETFREQHENTAAFNFDWPAQKATAILPELGEVIRSYRQALDHWRGTIGNRIQEELIRLNYKTAIPALAVTPSVKQLELDLEQFIDEVNASGLYQLPLQSKTLTLARQQKYLEDTIDQLEQSQTGLDTYGDFYHWQRFWFSLSAKTRKTIQALIRSRPDDWQAAFSSWYFNECLQKHYDPFPMVSEENRQTFLRDTARLRSRLAQVIRYHWNEANQQGLQGLKQALRQWPKSMDQLLSKYGGALADCYPVSFANPELAAKLAPHYDFVIMDSAQELSVPDTAGVLAKAKQLAVIADSEQLAMTKAGVVDYLRLGDVPTITQDDDRVPNLAELWTARQTQVYFHQVDGRFDEQQRTNEVEVQELLKLLNTVERKSGNVYPKVGILTLTKGQRDMIQRQLFRIKRERSPGAELIQQLERNGLTVLHVRDALEQRFDLIFYSPVYGPIDYQGHLSSLLPHLNQAMEQAGLSVLQRVLAEAQTVHFLNSLPMDEVTARCQWEESPGEQLQALTTSLAAARNSNDFTSIESLRKQWPVRHHRPATSDVLARELAYRLGELLPDWRWAFRTVPGTRQDALIATSPDGLPVVLLTDGFLSRARFTTIDWEQWQRDRLQLSGYQTLAFSTEALWKNPELACHRLSRQLVGLTLQEEE